MRRASRAWFRSTSTRRATCELINEYGPTEATVWATAHRCQPGGGQVPIGTPIPGTTVMVADAQGLAAPPGVLGELWIAGPNLADGYINDDEATAARFVTVAGERWYRTGDLAHIDDGLVWFDGRIDDQLSVNGIRVEPTEIELVLAGATGVLEAAVSIAASGTIDEQLATLSPAAQRQILADSARSTDPLSTMRRLLVESAARQFLVAHVVVDGTRPTVDAAIRGAAELLPPRLRPRAIRYVDALPRTHHGKLDRGTLIGITPPAVPAVSEDLTNPTINRILDAMRATVGPELTLHDDFFAAGGDSLAALAVVTRLESELGRTIMITELVDHPTAASLAGSLAGSLESTGTSQRSAPTGHPLLEWHGGAADRHRDHAVCPRRRSPHWVSTTHRRHPAAGVDHEIVGFRLPGLDGGTVPAHTIAAQVDAFWSALLDVASTKRRCLLIGGSSGGLIAWEVAARLRSLGRTHDVVMFMDTVHPQAHRDTRLPRWKKYPHLIMHEGLRATAAEVHEKVVAGTRILTNRARVKLRRTDAATYPSATVETPAAVSAQVAVERSVDDAVVTYWPPAHATPVVFLSASQSGGTYTLDYWEPILPRVRVVPVEGSHSGPDAVGSPARVHQWVKAINDTLQDWDELTMESGTDRIIHAIHDRRLRAELASLAADGHDVREQVALCQSLVDAAVGDSMELAEVLHDLAATLVPVDTADELFRLVRFRVTRRSAKQAIERLERLGYSAWAPTVGGAWQAYVRANQHVVLTRSDERSTRVELVWGTTEERHSRIGRVVTPSLTDLGFVSLPSPLWPLYWLLRPARLATQRLLARPSPHNLGPYLATPQGLTQAVVDWAAPSGNDLVIDIGCGDGRLLIDAVTRFGCRARGIELDPRLVALARARVAEEGLTDRIEIVCADASAAAADFGDATLVLLFLPASVVRDIVPKLRESLPTGPRIIAHEQAPIGGTGADAPTRVAPLVTCDGVTVASEWSVT